MTATAAGAELFDDPRRFWELARPMAAAREIENSLFLGVAREVARTNGAAFMLALVGDNGVEAAAILRGPQLLICLADDTVVGRLAQAVVETGRDVPAVMGPHGTALDFARHWATRTGRRSEAEMEESLYALTSVTPPEEAAPGALRCLTAADRAWVIDWTAAFATEAGRPEYERDRAYVTATVERKIAELRQFAWEVDGEPVTLASHTEAGITGVRIGGVRTPAAERGRGYASAAVAALSRQLLDAGYSWCSLFADVLALQPNRIYQRLGYREACRFRSIRLL